MQLPPKTFIGCTKQRMGFIQDARNVVKLGEISGEIDNPGWTVAAYRRAQAKLSNERKREISVRASFHKYGATQEWFDIKLLVKEVNVHMWYQKNQKPKDYIDHDHRAVEIFEHVQMSQRCCVSVQF